MSTKLQFYSEFADRTARQITGSYPGVDIVSGNRRAAL